MSNKKLHWDIRLTYFNNVIRLLLRIMNEMLSNIADFVK